MAEYPEHDKVKALGGQNQTVGRFLEWLEEQGLAVCERTETFADNLWMPCGWSIEETIARHFEIDRDRLEQEKRAMLDELRRK